MTYLAVHRHVILVGDLRPIIAVRLSDGELSATLRSLCDLLDLNQWGQIQRIRRSASLAKALQEATISTPGGPQQVEVLLNWAISIWAAGLQVSRLSDAKRAAAEVLQQKAFAAIEQAFVQVEPDSAAQPQPPQPSASRTPWQEGHAFIDHLQAVDDATRNQLAVLQYNQQSQARRIAALEVGKDSPTTGLPAQRLEYIYQNAHELRKRRGWPIAETLAGLADHFQSEDIYYLLEKEWPAILDWFASLLKDW